MRMTLDCPKCGKTASCEVLKSFEEEGPLDDRRISFMQCPECHAALLALQIAVGSCSTGNEYGPPTRLYPESDEWVEASIPPAIRRSLVEAKKCNNAHCHLAAAVMCRRTIEVFCKHHNAKGNNLADRITSLHSAGVIDDRLKKWADALRDDGNLAAHDPGASLSGEEASDLIAFTEALLEYVFVLSDRFSTFQAKRAARKTTNADGRAK